MKKYLFTLLSLMMFLFCIPATAHAASVPQEEYEMITIAGVIS